MPKFRVNANLVWDIEAETPDEARQLAEAMRDGVTIFPGSKWTALSLNKLRDTPKSKKVKRLAEYPAEEILPHTGSGNSRRQYMVGKEVYTVRMNSHRYLLFKNCRTCVVCGIEGTVMALELPPSAQNPHFNLYAVKDGRYVLMTKDHVQPVAKGGKDKLENYQAMCSICNGIKGADHLPIETLRSLRQFFDEKHGQVPSTDLHKLVIKEKEKCLGGTPSDERKQQKSQ